MLRHGASGEAARRRGGARREGGGAPPEKQQAMLSAASDVSKSSETHHICFTVVTKEPSENAKVPVVVALPPCIQVPFKPNMPRESVLREIENMKAGS